MAPSRLNFYATKVQKNFHITKCLIKKNHRNNKEFNANTNNPPLLLNKAGLLQNKGGLFPNKAGLLAKGKTNVSILHISYTITE